MTPQSPSTTAGDAVLQTAIQMEQDGRDFYEAVAAATADPKVRQLCVRLAADEARHAQTFRQMHSALAGRGRTVMLANGDRAAARRSARAAILPDPQTVRDMALRGDVAALLDLAIDVEVQSVAYYLGFVDGVPARGVLEAIVGEEREHLRRLRLLRAMRGGREPGK